MRRMLAIAVAFAAIFWFAALILAKDDSWYSVSSINRENEVVVLWKLTRSHGGGFNGFDNNPVTTTVRGYDASRQFFIEGKEPSSRSPESIPFVKTANYEFEFQPWISGNRIYPEGCSGDDNSFYGSNACLAYHPGKFPLPQVGHRVEEIWRSGRNIIFPVVGQADCVLPIPDRVVTIQDSRVAYFPSSQTLYLVEIDEEPNVLYVSKSCAKFERVDYSHQYEYVKQKMGDCRGNEIVFDIVPAANSIRPSLMAGCGNDSGVLNLDTAAFTPLPRNQHHFWGSDGTKVVLYIDSNADGEGGVSRYFVLAKILNIYTGEIEEVKTYYTPTIRGSMGKSWWQIW